MVCAVCRVKVTTETEIFRPPGVVFVPLCLSRARHPPAMLFLLKKAFEFSLQIWISSHTNEEMPVSFDMKIFADGILKGRVAFVTGGGTGITGGVARALAEAGANVALVSRRIEHLEPAAQGTKAKKN